MSGGIDPVIKGIGASGKACCCLWRNLWMASGFIFLHERSKNQGPGLLGTVGGGFWLWEDLN